MTPIPFGFPQSLTEEARSFASTLSDDGVCWQEIRGNLKSATVTDFQR
jgi:hypothetical protein